MKVLSFLIAVFLCSFSAQADTHILSKIKFENSMDANLHLYLYHLAKNDEYFQSNVTDNKNLSDDAREVLTKSMQTYKSELEKDGVSIFFSDAELANVTRQVMRGKTLGGDDCGITCSAHQQSVDVYRQYFWPEHEKVNQAWIEKSRVLLKKYADKIISKSKDMMHGSFFPKTGAIRIDVVYKSTRRGAFTSGRTPNVLINSTDAGYQGYHALEMLIHEMAHFSLTGPKSKFRKLFLAELNNEGLSKHHRYWHAVHFYTIGYLTQENIGDTAPEFIPYAKHKNIYRRSWATYLSMIEKHWLPYLKGTGSFEEAIENLVQGLK